MNLPPLNPVAVAFIVFGFAEILAAIIFVIYTLIEWNGKRKAKNCLLDGQYQHEYKVMDRLIRNMTFQNKDYILNRLISFANLKPRNDEYVDVLTSNYLRRFAEVTSKTEVA